VDDSATLAPLHWPVTTLLSPPQVWAGDAPRRRRAHVPVALAFHPKTDLARVLLDRARQWGVALHVMVADAGYGDAPSFLAALKQRAVPYVCAVATTFDVFYKHTRIRDHRCFGQPDAALGVVPTRHARLFRRTY
jgi:SRSO17 transposase